MTSTCWKTKDQTFRSRSEVKPENPPSLNPGSIILSPDVFGSKSSSHQLKVRAESAFGQPDWTGFGNQSKQNSTSGSFEYVDTFSIWTPQQTDQLGQQPWTSPLCSSSQQQLTSGSFRYSYSAFAQQNEPRFAFGVPQQQAGGSFGQQQQPSTSGLTGTSTSGNAEDFRSDTTQQQEGMLGQQQGNKAGMLDQQPLTSSLFSTVQENKQSRFGFGIPDQQTGHPFRQPQQPSANDLLGTRTFGQQSELRFDTPQLQSEAQPQGSLLFQPAVSRSKSINNILGTVGTAKTGTAIKNDPIIGVDFDEKNNVHKLVETKHHCITTMKEYEDKSLEELCYEDYLTHGLVKLIPQAQAILSQSNQNTGGSSSKKPSASFEIPPNNCNNNIFGTGKMCGRCLSFKLDSFLTCRGNCNRSFHYSCANFSTTEYEIFSRNKNVAFLCDDCVNGSFYSPAQLVDPIEQRVQNFDSLLQSKFTELVRSFTRVHFSDPNQSRTLEVAPGSSGNKTPKGAKCVDTKEQVREVNPNRSGAKIKGCTVDELPDSIVMREFKGLSAKMKIIHIIEGMDELDLLEALVNEDRLKKNICETFEASHCHQLVLYFQSFENLVNGSVSYKCVHKKVHKGGPCCNIPRGDDEMLKMLAIHILSKSNIFQDDSGQRFAVYNLTS